jgi:hypothetical protein
MTRRRVLCLSGSLGRRSGNTALLKVAQLRALSGEGWEVGEILGNSEHCTALAALAVSLSGA